MVTNKNKCMYIETLIGGLRVVHVCSIANSGYRDNFKPVHFLFYEKIFIVKKHKKSTRNPKKAKKSQKKMQNKKLLSC